MNQPAYEYGAVTVEALLKALEGPRAAGKKVVFTNGCFDLVHPGHVTYLAAARRLGDLLVVGLNSDESVKRLGKGDERPIMNERERAAVLGALKPVDFVVVFNDDTPLSLIERIVPDVLVKGGDWPVEKIVGREVVQNAGGEVKTISFVEGSSTTGIVERILDKCSHT